MTIEELNEIKSIYEVVEEEFGITEDQMYEVESMDDVLDIMNFCKGHGINDTEMECAILAKKICELNCTILGWIVLESKENRQTLIDLLQKLVIEDSDIFLKPAIDSLSED